MAQLPRFNSQRNINTQANARVVDINSAKSDGQNLTNLGKAGQGLASKFQNAINSTQKTKKQNELSLGTSDILTRATQGNELIEVHQQELEDLRIKASEGFIDNTALTAFKPDIDRSINNAKIKLNGIFRKKTLDEKSAQRLLQSEINRDAFIKDGDQTHIDLELSQIATDLQEGFIKKKEAAEQIIKANNLPEQRVKTLKAQDVMVQRQLKLNQLNNELDLVNEIKDKGLAGISISNILEKAASKEDDSVRTKFANAVVGAITNPDIYKDSALDNPDFNIIIENTLKLTDKQAVNNLLLDALDQSGKVSQDEMNIIIGVAIAKSGTLKGLDSDSGDVSQSDKFTFLDGLKFFFTNAGKKQENNFGLRKDGTQKGDGFLGVLQRPDGQISTEISIGINVDGKEIEIPTLVPTLTKQEIDFLLEGNSPTQVIVDKAIRHAQPRINKGRSPFKDKKDIQSTKSNNIQKKATRKRSDTQKNKSQKIRTFVERVEAGIDPDKALQDIQNEEMLKRFPFMKDFPKEGKLKTDSNGNTRRYFANGSFEEIP